uniref:Uncharacterized protein n=1 Tax=Physcomitrium patens TaxID=3218 RepID=A9SHR4_PHYPA|nr:hypothetical protein PHYPA_015176 [Physcomitrium patens]
MVEETVSSAWAPRHRRRSCVTMEKQKGESFPLGKQKDPWTTSRRFHLSRQLRTAQIKGCMDNHLLLYAFESSLFLMFPILFPALAICLALYRKVSSTSDDVAGAYAWTPA